MSDKQLLQRAWDSLAVWKETYPEGWDEEDERLMDDLITRLAQPEPEPVAWGLQQQFEAGIGTTPVAFKRHDEFGFVVPLYTAPPQREWQGLTDKEIEDCLEMSIYGTCRAIEAKLKEKNT